MSTPAVPAQQQASGITMEPVAPVSWPATLRALLWQLRRSSGEEQRALLRGWWQQAQQHHIAQRVTQLPPVAIAVRVSRRAMHVGAQGRRTLATLRARLLDATLGPVLRSMPYRCVAAYTRMLLADARVAMQLHAAAAAGDARHAHSSSYISATAASCSLSPLAPHTPRLAALGWRTRRFVYAMARFTGQSRHLMFSRSLRHWPLDAAALYFQLLLLFLPLRDPRYDAVRDSLTDVMRWYETKEAQRVEPAEEEEEEEAGPVHARHASRRLQVEGQRSQDESFLAELSAESSVSPVRLTRMYGSEFDTESQIGASPIRFASNLSTAASTPGYAATRMDHHPSMTPMGASMAAYVPFASPNESALWPGASPASSQRGGMYPTHPNHSLSQSLDSSHARAVYNRAMELLAQGGIDLDNVSMDDTLNESPPESDGESEQWEEHSQGARELFTDDGHTDNDADAREDASDAHGITELSLAELDHTDAEPGGFTPEGRQRMRRHEEEHARAAASAAIGDAVAAGPLPRLLLPLQLHVSTRHLAVTQRLLSELHPLLASGCSSHSLLLEVLNDELRTWNYELALGGSAGSASLTAAAPSHPAPQASSGLSDLRAPPMHLLVHDWSEHGGLEQLIGSMDSISKHQQVLVASSFFLVLLHSSSSATPASTAASVAMAQLSSSASRHPLLQALCTSKQVTLVAVQGQHIASGQEDAGQRQRMQQMADRMLEVARQAIDDQRA